MIPQTIAVTIFFCALALSRRQAGSALGIVIVSMMLWPEYLRIPIGFAEMSAPRIVALLLLLKSLFSGAHRGIHFQKVDGLVLLIWLWTVFATIAAGAALPQITQMIGRGLDTVLMYFLARVSIRTPKDVQGLFVWLAAVAIVMGVLGSIESTMSQSPYAAMTDYRTWHWFDKDNEYRYGFMRAKVSTSTHIYFGMAMMVILGVLFSIRGYAGSRASARVAITASVLGALSSMSSGPWIGCVFVLLLNGFQARTSWMRPAIYGILFAALFLELLSNRHFYNLIDYFALDAHTAWYRTRLLEVAFSRLGEYWIVGTGSNWPHYWGMLVDGRRHIDVVNHFVIVALYGGIPAVLLYVSTHVIGIRLTISAWRKTDDDRRRKLLFGLAATLVAVDFSSMSVGLFGPVLALSHILLGGLISASVAWPEKQARLETDELKTAPRKLDREIRDRTVPV